MKERRRPFYNTHKLLSRTAIYDGDKNILVVATHFFGAKHKLNNIVDTIPFNYITLCFSCDNNVLYFKKQIVLNTILSYIDKYNIKKLVFYGICRDTLYQAELIYMIRQLKIYDDVCIHFIGVPFCSDITDDEFLRDMSPEFYLYLKHTNKYNLVKCLDIESYLKNVQNLILYPIICNKNINPGDTKFIMSNTHLSFKTITYITIDELTTQKDSHTFFVWLYLYNIQLARDIMKDIFSYII